MKGKGPEQRGRRGVLCSQEGVRRRGDGRGNCAFKQQTDNGQKGKIAVREHGEKT